MNRDEGPSYTRVLMSCWRKKSPRSRKLQVEQKIAKVWKSTSLISGMKGTEIYPSLSIKEMLTEAFHFQKSMEGM